VAPFFDFFGPFKPYSDSNYIAFVMIAFDYHA